MLKKIVLLTLMALCWTPSAIGATGSSRTVRPQPLALTPRVTRAISPAGARGAPASGGSPSAPARRVRVDDLVGIESRSRVERAAERRIPDGADPDNPEFIWSARPRGTRFYGKPKTDSETYRPVNQFPKLASNPLTADQVRKMQAEQDPLKFLMQKYPKRKDQEFEQYKKKLEQYIKDNPEEAKAEAVAFAIEQAIKAQRKAEVETPIEKALKKGAVKRLFTELEFDQLTKAEQISTGRFGKDLYNNLLKQILPHLITLDENKRLTKTELTPETLLGLPTDLQKRPVEAERLNDAEYFIKLYNDRIATAAAKAPVVEIKDTPDDRYLKLEKTTPWSDPTETKAEWDRINAAFEAAQRKPAQGILKKPAAASAAAVDTPPARITGAWGDAPSKTTVTRGDAAAFVLARDAADDTQETSTGAAAGYLEDVEDQGGGPRVRVVKYADGSTEEVDSY